MSVPTLLLAWVGVSVVVTGLLVFQWHRDGRRDRDMEQRLEEYLAPLRADAQVEALDAIYYAPAYGEVV